MNDFWKGAISGWISSIGVILLWWLMSDVHNNSGYSDKMVIEYHCPVKEYNRDLFLDMVKTSGIQTNFLNKECSMDKYRIKYTLTNPEKK